MNRPTVKPPRAHGSVAFLAFALWSVCAAGCEDPNKMFEGVWETTFPAHDDLDGQLQGAPTLAIGHYGRDLTGLVYFHETLGASAFTLTCPCAIISQGIGDTIDLDNRRVSFSTTCHDQTSETVSLDWDLTMGDESDPEDRSLTGTVQRSDGGPDAVPVEFLRVSLEVEESDKQCPPL